MKSKWFSAGILSSLTVLAFFIVAASLVTAEIPPPVSGIEISEYSDSIIRQSGTIGTYQVEIKNIGILSLYDVRLEAEKLPEGWFSSSSDPVAELGFGDIAILEYELAVPEGVSGLYAFSLITRGSYGVSTVSDIEPVVLNVLLLPEPEVGAETTTTTVPVTTTTTTTTTTAVETTTTIGITTPEGTTQPPIVYISEDLPEMIEQFKEKLKSGWSGYLCSDTAFSKFRAAVTYVRTNIKAVLTDESLVYRTAFVLFAVMLVLMVVEKLMRML